MKAEEVCLLVQADGDCHGLYTEVIDLSLLGNLNVARAMTIEFDNRLQAWRVSDQEGDCLYCSPSRELCLAWERQHLNWVLENE